MTSPGDAARAVEMRLAGAAPQAIASATGFASAAEAMEAVKQALGASGALPERVDAAVTELARLDALMLGLWPRARRGEAAAIEAVLKISDRRMRILADAPSVEAEPAEEKVRTPLDELNARRAARGSTAAGKGVPKVAAKRG